MNMNRTALERGPWPIRAGLSCTCDRPDSPVVGDFGRNWHYCPRHGDAAVVREGERRANLLAALNDCPTSLIGWDSVVESRRARWVMTLNGPARVPGRWANLDALWFAVQVDRAARRVGEQIGGVLRALAPTYRRGGRTNYGGQDDYTLAPDSPNRK